MVTTLKTLVQKTATVTSVKLLTPADRIGLGFGVAYPTDTLSPGQFPLPHNPEPESARSRQERSGAQTRMRLSQGGDAVPPAGPAGCSPGVSAGRPASSPFGWRRATRAAAAGRTLAGCRFADHDRADLPGDCRHDGRLGSDCQSPDRSGDKRVALRAVGLAATAGK